MFAAVVMPCWNLVHMTQDAVESLRKHAGRHRLHFVFVDNGSTDGALGYLQSVRDATVIHNNENMLVTHAWNQGLKAAQTIGAEAIFLLNNDIIACPEWAEPIARELKVHGHDHYFHAHSPFPGYDDLDNVARRMLPALRGKKACGKCGWAFFFRADAVEKFMSIPEDFKVWHGDNWIHWNLVVKHGYNREVLLDCLIYHRGSISFLKLGYERDIAEVVAPDTIAFERIIGMTVAEFCAVERVELGKYTQGG